MNRRTFLERASTIIILSSSGVAAFAKGGIERSIEVVGPWQIRVSPGRVRVGRKRVRIKKETLLEVAPATLLTIRDEKYESLPLFNAQAFSWQKGARLRALVTFETTADNMLVPESFVLKSGPGNAARYIAGKDYQLEAEWATVGRLPEGIAENQAVWSDYECGLGRIDSIEVDSSGVVSIRHGEPHNATPRPPAPSNNNLVIANIWIPGRLTSLTKENLFPILEPFYPELKHSKPPALSLLPKTWEKLRKGEPLHILAWGDSVTAGAQTSDASHQYQQRFVSTLKSEFPDSTIRLTTVGWPSSNSDSFLVEPPGSDYNFDRAVIENRPDLVIMEFVNDSYLTPELVEEKYSYLHHRFQQIGAEWIILTPHFVRPNWMGADSVRLDSDPRPYVKGVRQFTSKHGVALADASLRWGHLWKEGIPYTTLLCNGINHPDDRGHELFALSLLELFRRG
jgi:hypothetical protein